MHTNFHIGIWNEDGTLDVIYLHWEGYPGHNGASRIHNYKDLDKIREEIALGEISPTHFTTFDEYKNFMSLEDGYIEFVYLYNVADRKWLWSPICAGIGIEELQNLTESNLVA